MAANENLGASNDAPTTPAEALRKVIEIEKEIGRVEREKWHEREIDIDILFYNRKSIKTGKLVIPHPQIQHRNFVLKPLMELMPGFIHPVLEKNIKTIYMNTKDTGKVSIYKSQL